MMSQIIITNDIVQTFGQLPQPFRHRLYVPVPVVDIPVVPVPNDIGMVSLLGSVCKEECTLLNIVKTNVVRLISFEILLIRIVPYTVASIDIKILTDTEHIILLWLYWTALALALALAQYQY